MPKHQPPGTYKSGVALTAANTITNNITTAITVTDEPINGQGTSNLKNNFKILGVGNNHLWKSNASGYVSCTAEAGVFGFFKLSFCKYNTSKRLYIVSESNL
jgi:hypothetical protein